MKKMSNRNIATVVNEQNNGLIELSNLLYPIGINIFQKKNIIYLNLDPELATRSIINITSLTNSISKYVYKEDLVNIVNKFLEKLENRKIIECIYKDLSNLSYAFEFHSNNKENLKALCLVFQDELSNITLNKKYLDTKKNISTICIEGDKKNNYDKKISDLLKKHQDFFSIHMFNLYRFSLNQNSTTQKKLAKEIAAYLIIGFISDFDSKNFSESMEFYIYFEEIIAKSLLASYNQKIYQKLYQRMTFEFFFSKSKHKYGKITDLFEGFFENEKKLFKQLFPSASREDMINFDVGVIEFLEDWLPTVWKLSNVKILPNSSFFIGVLLTADQFLQINQLLILVLLHIVYSLVKHFTIQSSQKFSVHVGKDPQLEEFKGKLSTVALQEIEGEKTLIIVNDYIQRKKDAECNVYYEWPNEKEEHKRKKGKDKAKDEDEDENETKKPNLELISESYFTDDETKKSKMEEDDEEKKPETSSEKIHFIFFKPSHAHKDNTIRKFDLHDKELEKLDQQSYSNFMQDVNNKSLKICSLNQQSRGSKLPPQSYKIKITGRDDRPYLILKNEKVEENEKGETYNEQTYEVRVGHHKKR